MNENRSSDTFGYSSCIGTGRSSNIVNGPLALVCCTDTRVWTMAFVALDVVLIFGTWRATRFAVSGALLTATVQLAAMLGDIIAGEPAGLPVLVFRNYLLADTAYLGLLITQAFIMAIAIGTWALPHVHGHWLASLEASKK